MTDFGFSHLSLNERIEVQVPGGAKGMIIGKGGSTIKSLQQKTGCKIFSPDKSSNFFVVTGSSENVEKARSEIEGIVQSFKQKKLQKTPDQNNNLPQCGGRLPKNWLHCPPSGTSLIDGFIMPIKCPLHENFTSNVLREGGNLWRLDEAMKLGDFGLIVDLTDTNRYYDPEEATGVKHKKLSLNIHRPDGLPFSKIHDIVDQIANFHRENPTKIVAVHWYVVVHLCELL